MRARASFCVQALVLTVLSGCQTNMYASDRYAVLVDVTPAVHATIESAISAALPGMQITVAPDALSQTSLLTLERPVRQRLDGEAGLDRRLDTPERFRLVVNDGRCVLIHEAKSTRYPLDGARCTPEP